nr:J380 [uncultured bacterium]
MEYPDQKPMPVLKQDSSRVEVRMATRLAMANRDLLESGSYLHILDSVTNNWQDPDTGKWVQRALLNSAVICYAKSFSTNQGSEIAHRKIRLECFSNVDEDLHSHLMNLRNRVIAHSDATAIPAQIVDHEHKGLLMIATPKFDVLEEVDPGRLRAQISTLLDQIQRQLHEYSDFLRAIPGALGSKVQITIHNDAEPSIGESET